MRAVKQILAPLSPRPNSPMRKPELCFRGSRGLIFSGFLRGPLHVHVPRQAQQKKKRCQSEMLYSIRGQTLDTFTILGSLGF
jgi:hypothetical protein